MATTETGLLSPAAAHRLMALRRFYFRPAFIGLENIDLRRPALFVGNHTRYGLLDVPLLLEHLYVHHGVLLRALGDRAHFTIPLWRDYLQKGGMVLGTPENCDALMQAGESVLVFPGGAREVWRRRDEQYTLIWKNRLGFVRQAIKHGYDIIPFAAVGADDCYSVIKDANDWLGKAWLQPLLTHPALRGGDLLPPLATGIGPSLLPRPERFYFGFSGRIATADLHGRENAPDTLWAVREQVAQAINGQVQALLQRREHERHSQWSWLRRALTQARPSHASPGALHACAPSPPDQEKQ